MLKKYLLKLRGNLALEEYKVIIELIAQRDLQDILHYIMDTLKEPEIAKQTYIKIKRQILTLSPMPMRYSIVQDQPYSVMGVRKLPIENYMAFYIINEQKCEVHVLRILYNRREWQNIL